MAALIINLSFQKGSTDNSCFSSFLLVLVDKPVNQISMMARLWSHNMIGGSDLDNMEDKAMLAISCCYQ